MFRTFTPETPQKAIKYLHLHLIIEIKLIVKVDLTHAPLYMYIQVVPPVA